MRIEGGRLCRIYDHFCSGLFVGDVDQSRTWSYDDDDVSACGAEYNHHKSYLPSVS